jgi:phenylalanyl-tRNA synthetase beta chain
VKFTASQLAKMIDHQLSPEELGNALTMAGFELEEILEAQPEPILDVNIMANRGDAASLLGMAREAAGSLPEAALTELMTRSAARPAASDAAAPDIRALTRVDIEADDCTRYACRIFRNVQNGPSPAWLQKELEQMGQRPISLLVDLTNYVMLEQGQPLHAFDLDKLSEKRIVVRYARPEETITTLDGEERTLQPHHMVIADAERAIAVAGVMGGLETEVSESTEWCLLESANFRPRSVRRTRKELGLNTEASWRFERHVDPEITAFALDRFAELYQEITGHSPEPGVIDERRSAEEPRQVIARLDRAERLLGFEIDPEEALHRLHRLGFGARRNGVRITVDVPSWRADVLREEDVIEDLGRTLGYDRIPSVLPEGSTELGGLQGREAMIESLRQEALRCGFHQMVSHTLGGEHPLDSADESVRVRSPHSPDMALLRGSHWPRLADALRVNGWGDLRVFEVGRTHHATGEVRRLALAACGRTEAPSWRNTKPGGFGFFEMKGVVERLLERAGAPAAFRASADPRLHPTRQAEIWAGDHPVGLIGEIHPDLAVSLGWAAGLKRPEGSWSLAEINLEALPLGESRGYQGVSRLPALGRDIAVLTPLSLPFQQVEAAIRKAAGPWLESLRLFDVYEGPGVESGWQSWALALQWRHPERSLTDAEGNQMRDAVVQALESLGAKLR